MVLLRLEVRVYPREPAPSQSFDRGAPNTGFISRFMGNGIGKGNNDQDSSFDRSQESSYDHLKDPNPAKPYASFLMLLKNSGELSLGDLAKKISDEWASFRSDQEPLQIKKLLDDANPTVDLGMSMTVEDVFVDTGKASADGHDQRAIVRVVQKPAAYAPQRFASVDQDWDSAVGRRSNNQLANTGRFDTIEEEETPSNSARESLTGHRQHDAPLPSVEAQPKYHRNGSIPRSPDNASSGSEELGDSPSPRKPRGSRKRKQSLGEDGPVKQRRVEETQSQANDLVSPHRKRATVPTFASPRRRPSLSERQDVNNNIGLGVTRSPLFNTPVDSDASSRYKTRLTAANTLAQSKNQPPHSAMRKSPTSSHSEKRRSVSFNESVVNAEARPTPKTSSSKAKKTQHVDGKKAMQGTPTSKGSPAVLPNSNTKSTPKEELLDAQFARIQARIAQKKAMEEKERQGKEKGGQGKEKERQDKERERQEKERERQEKEKEERERQKQSERREKEKARREEEEKEEEEKERANLEAKLADSSTDATIKSIAEKILQKWRRVDETREKKDSLDDGKFKNAIRSIKRQLNPLRKRLEDLEATKATEQPEIREASPPMPDARITRSLRSPGAAASSTTEAPTWSFGNVTQASPCRRGSRNSANGLHESPRRPQSSHLSPDLQQIRSPSVVIHNSPRRGGSFTKPPTEAPNPAETDVEMKDADEEATHTVADEPAEQPINEAPEKEIEEATEEASDDSSSESSEERSRESSKALGEEPKPPSISNTNEAEEDDGDDSDEVAESELNDGDNATNQYQDTPAAPSGLIDDVAEDDDEEEDEEEEDSEMDDFIDDGEEESEEEEDEEEDDDDDEDEGEEEYEDAKDHEEPSVQDTVNGIVDAQVEETQEDKTEPPAENNNEDERDESGNEWAEVSEGNQPDEPQVKPQESLNNEDSSEASSEESDESDSDIELPLPNKVTQKSPNTPNPSQGFQSTQPTASSQSRAAPRMSLKSLLQVAKQEQQKPAPAVASTPRLSNSGSKPKQNVWEVPSSDEEDSNSDDSDQGDILPNGHSRKPRKPYSQRG